MLLHTKGGGPVAGGGVDSFGGGVVVAASGGGLPPDCLLLRPLILDPLPTPLNITFVDMILFLSPAARPGMTCGAPDSLGYTYTTTQVLV